MNLPKAYRPAPALSAIIERMEAKIKHHIFLSDSLYGSLRAAPHRQRSFRFLDLPAEVREKIYEKVWGTRMDYYFSILVCFPSVSIRRLHNRGLPLTRGNALLRVNKQVSGESAHVLYSRAVLHIDSAPHRKPENLQFLTSVPAAWFLSSTRRLCIQSDFGFALKRNVAYVKALGRFSALIELEILLDLDAVLEETALKDCMVNLLPFTTIVCETITFRGPSYSPKDMRKEVEATWQEICASRQTPTVNILWDYTPKRRRIALEEENP